MTTFVYNSYSIEGNTFKFNYSAGEYRFTHQVIFENISSLNSPFIFHLGIAEMFSYWKLFCSPEIEIRAGYLTPSQVAFWHKLTLKGMGQYFYENKIDFTKKDFLKISSFGNRMPTNANRMTMNDKVLIPIGGGKDSIVTYELLKNHFDVKPIIVYPTTPASEKMFPNSIIVRRILDPQITGPGFLKGHIPYSAILAFIFLIPGYKYIAVSSEKSSEEGNVEYLGHTINHQYSKTLEFETDFNNYIKNLTDNWQLPTVNYFSFLRPLYELQITKLFSNMPQYFDQFRSCNKNQKQNSWCGHCPKCISTALLLKPFLSHDQIVKIIGRFPTKSEMSQLTIVKPFECILTRAEAQAVLDKNLAPILTSWQDNPNMPDKFEKILHQAYANS